MRSIDGIVEAKTIGDLLVAGIAQHDVTAANQHRDVGGADVKPIEQLLGVGVAIEINVVMRMPVAGQKLLHAKRAGAMQGSDHHHIAETARNELAAAQDKRAHQDFAQLRVGLDEAQYLIAAQLCDLAVATDAQAGQRAAAGNHVAFAGELAGTVRDDHFFAGLRRHHHLDLAAQHHEHRHGFLPDINEHLAACHRASCPERDEAFELCCRQHWKYSVVARRHGAQSRMMCAHGMAPCTDFTRVSAPIVTAWELRCR